MEPGALAPVHPHHAALVDRERELAVLELECRLAEQFAPPAMQGADLGLKAAGEAFRVLTSLAPDEEAPRGKLALVRQLEGDWAGAERELLYVVEKNPDNVEFTLRLGVLFTEQAKQSSRPEERKEAAGKAERWLRKVLEAQPENAMASRALQQLKSP
mgnify:CR=1 FL=1